MSAECSPSMRHRRDGAIHTSSSGRSCRSPSVRIRRRTAQVSMDSSPSSRRQRTSGSSDDMNAASRSRETNSNAHSTGTGLHQRKGSPSRTHARGSSRRPNQRGRSQSTPCGEDGRRKSCDERSSSARPRSRSRGYRIDSIERHSNERSENGRHGKQQHGNKRSSSRGALQSNRRGRSRSSTRDAVYHEKLSGTKPLQLTPKKVVRNKSASQCRHPLMNGTKTPTL
mmetsp:Transcript_4363/g.11433  ORF Transcript_4363/g.11433 Transcript_4363/m.11433 type:complete len:226 (+) Transcript_4363:1550-2227(+)